MSVEQQDRDATAEYLGSGGWGNGAEYVLANLQDSHPLVQAFAAHREAAEQSAKAEIVAWLRVRALPHTCTADRDIADAIERGEFKP